MNITVDDLGPCKKLVRLEIDEAGVAQEAAKVTRSYTQQVQLPGFRKGKAPKHLLMRNYGDDIRDKVKSNLINDSLQKTIKDNKFKLVQVGDIEVIDFNIDGKLSYAANIEILPSFDLPTYKGLKIEPIRVTVTDEDVENALGALAEQRAEYVDAETPLQDGQFAVIDFSATYEGKPLEETFDDVKSLAGAKKQWVRIEEADFIPGLINALRGQSKGAEVSFQSTFPEDYAYDKLAGKSVDYSVTVVEVKSRKLPEINEEFAQSFGAESLEKLKEGVRTDLDQEAEQQYRTDLRNKIVSSLMDGQTFEVPASLVENQTRQIVYEIVYQNQRSGMSKESISEHTDEIYSIASKSADKRVRTNIVLEAIAEAEEIKVSNEELANYIAHLSQQRGTKPEKLVQELRESGGVNNVVSEILIAKAVDLIQLNAEISDVKKTRAEIQAEQNNSSEPSSE